jgi:hypothetical protein
MCAMMPMLRVFSSGNLRGMDSKDGGRRLKNEERARTGPHASSFLLSAEPYVVEVSIAY